MWIGAIRLTFGVLQVLAKIRTNMTTKYDEYLKRLSTKLIIGIALAIIGIILVHTVFGDVDLRIILIPLWIVGFIYALKYIYYFIKSFFSD